MGCAEKSSALVSGADSKQDLTVLLAQHDALVEKLAAEPPQALTKCELGAGDCLVLVAERRVELTERHGLRTCGAGNETGDTCLIEQLRGTHNERAISDYVTFKNWCFVQVLECVEATASEETEQTIETRGQSRRRKVEASPPVVEQWHAVETAQARVDYLRATLPPQAGAVCALPEVSDCHHAIAQRLSDLDAEFGIDEYDEGRAARTYAAIKHEEAACFRPELYCLTNALAPYGLAPESRALLDRNLAALDRRQKLAFSADPDAQAECVSGEETRHETAIDAAFQAYTRAPVLRARLQLEQAELALHEAQIACFAARSNGAPLAESSGVIDLD
jgi:hypothetical protein